MMTSTDKWVARRVYSAAEAVAMTAQMHRGAWKGRVSPDELEILQRVVSGSATATDFATMDAFGVTPKNLSSGEGS